MSTISVSTSRLAGSAGRTFATNPVLTAFRRLGREWTYLRARRAMATLDEGALHDMGVSRGEIDAVVRHGRARRSR